MAPSETRNIDDFPLFDWLRLAMAAAVAAFHFRLIPWGEAGNLAVQVFFALSGWLIGSILIEMHRDKLPLFYFNRATRVWIPYAVAMALLYGLSLLRDPVDARWFEFLAYDVTFTHNWFSLLPEAERALAEMPLQGTGNHFWSLAVEEQFYLAAPLLILFTPIGRSPWTWLAIGGITIALDSHFGAISLGVAAAAAAHHHPGFQLRPWMQAAMTALLVASIPLLFMDNAYNYAAPFFSIALVMLLARPGERSEIARFAGGISYPLYLNHWIAGFVANGVFKRIAPDIPIVQGLVALAGAIVVGSAAYLLVDKPVLAHRKAWFTPARGRALAATAYGLFFTGMAIGLTLHAF